MRVYIAHAEADQEIAEELKESMKPWGMYAETESGARGFRPLQRSDVVIALWSRHALFAAHRMQIERRMLEAWADQRLILVKLDHQFLPVGLRDLPAIDGTFESARNTVTWREVQRKTKEAMNRALVAMQTPEPDSESVVDSPGEGGGEKEEEPGPALFVSYAHADSDAVSPLVTEIEAAGRSVWIDRGEIAAGDSWAGEIVRAIKAAAGVLVMCSPRAFESDHIKREVYLADRYKRSMLPIFLEPVDPPEDFEYFFAAVQWLNCFDLDPGDRAQALANAIKGF